MTISVGILREWLDKFSDEDLVGIDEGGILLKSLEGEYIEVGGLSEGCTCGNTKVGFDYVCEWIRLHPGNNQYTCEFCGVYSASKPRCNMCQEEK